jgi:glycosyltransferase involved in cell wall biosynthesis
MNTCGGTASPGEAMRVLMLIQNDWKHDSRVIREAEALVRQGYIVDVVCRRQTTDTVVEEHGGVRYHCIPHTSRYSVGALATLVKLHFTVMFLDALRLWHGPARGAAAIAACRLLGAAGAAFVLLVPIAFLSPVLLAFKWARARAKTWRAYSARIPYAPRLFNALAALIKSAWSLVVPLLQPILYLNDFAYACMGTIRAQAPDVIHAHDLVTLSAGSIAARALRCRLIYDAHELETHTNYYSLNSWTKYWVARYEAALARRADRVITVCNSIADWLERRYSISRPLVVLNAPSGKSPVLTRVEGRASVRARLALPEGTPLIVYVGSVTIDRGLEHCVRSLIYLPTAHFAVVGPRYDVTEAAMSRVATEVGVFDRLHFIDPVPSSDVMSFIRTAHCGVMAIQNVCLSYYFCFPNKLLESVLAGLPVAVANLPELRAFVEEHGVGVVMDETDPQSIAGAIETILGDPVKYRPSNMKIAKIEKHYGWPTQAERLVGLYRSINT